MSMYQITSEKGQKFLLQQEQQIIGSLEYEKWYSLKASITVGHQDIYQVAQKGFWGTKMEVTQNENVIMDFSMGWNGSIVFNFKNTSNDGDFALRQRGFLKSAFVLSNKEGEELLSLKPDFKWNKFNYDYEAETSDSLERMKDKDLILLVALHSCNYYMTMMAGAI